MASSKKNVTAAALRLAKLEGTGHTTLASELHFLAMTLAFGLGSLALVLAHKSVVSIVFRQQPMSEKPEFRQIRQIRQLIETLLSTTR